MYWERDSVTAPEKAFLIVLNAYTTASLTNGQAVQWDTDGVGVTRPTARATSAGHDVAGIVTETIASAANGLMQVFGYHAATRVRQDTSSAAQNVASRVPLALSAAGSVFCLEPFATSSTSVLVYPVGFALGAQASWTTKATPVFIKAL